MQRVSEGSVTQSIAAREKLLVISDIQSTLDLSQSPLALPSGIPEWISLLPAIVPGQLFAYYLTLAKGNDAEKLDVIRKVTETR